MSLIFVVFCNTFKQFLIFIFCQPFMKSKIMVCIKVFKKNDYVTCHGCILLSLLSPKTYGVALIGLAIPDIS